MFECLVVNNKLISNALWLHKLTQKFQVQTPHKHWVIDRATTSAFTIIRIHHHPHPPPPTFTTICIHHHLHPPPSAFTTTSTFTTICIHHHLHPVFVFSKFSFLFFFLFVFLYSHPLLLVNTSAHHWTPPSTHQCHHPHANTTICTHPQALCQHTRHPHPHPHLHPDISM